MLYVNLFNIHKHTLNGGCMLYVNWLTYTNIH